MILLFACAAACGTSRPADLPARANTAPLPTWTPVSLSSISREDVRKVITDLLGFIDIDWLWPEYTWSDHAVILVVADPREGPIAYCVGICAPELSAGGNSRVWRSSSPLTIAPGRFRFTPLSACGLRGSGDIVAIGFDHREHSIVTAVHEDFHLHYQSRYAIAFGDLIGADSEMSSATRASLENHYSHAEPTASELRGECTSLVEALRAGTRQPEAALAALRRFVSIRESRRARSDAPSGEEDYWERHEGVPTNLERRAAARLEFADQSAIAAAVTGRGCDTITSGSYFLVLGGLEAAVLDTFSDPHKWPPRVYPRDGTRASSLFALVRALSLQSDER